ncbi:MAG: histidine--tRNA ligase [Clostridia bacterium]|nr:histidine--tRNA ligase [Clostridia bacterium]
MALITQAPRGTQDVLPENSYKWQYVEQTALSIARDFGFHEIRTPVFEHTNLFQRSVGETTDVVQKEMYTFEDKGGRSITLRPEGTAGAARAVLEHGLLAGALPVKVSYVTSCYRYEKSQKGRYREFHQFGVECFGASAPQADAETISLAMMILGGLGLSNVALHINSIGCPSCRARYHEALHTYFEARKADLCGTCLSRLERNPMRILDCKSPVCHGIAAEAPVMLDYLCDDCAEHFASVKECLDAAGIQYVVDTHIVRGLDYYTRTVFELVSDQGLVVAGGGRYDGLVSELGGAAQPGLGFAMGIERLLMVMEEQGARFPEAPVCDLYLVSMGQAAAKRCFALATALREGGATVECDIVGRSLKAQMKYADKLGARYTVVVGDNELETGRAQLKDMTSGSTEEVPLDEGLYSILRQKLLDRELAGVADLFGSVAEFV